MIEQGLFQLIQSDPTTSSLVSMANGNGVAWILAPKAWLLPYIVLNRVTTLDTITMVGDVGFRNALFQIDAYAGDYYTSRKIALAIRDLLKSYLGNLPDTDATAVGGVFQTKDEDLMYEEGGVGFVFRAMQVFRIWYYDTSVAVPLVVDGGSF
jgi:hypothetical protein